MSRPRRSFSAEFKDELCREVIESSKPVSEVAKAYGIGDDSLRRWLAKYRDTHGGGTDSELTLTERARLNQLEREVRELRSEAAFLKKAAFVLRAGTTVVAKYEFIDSYDAGDFPATSIVDRCRWLEVSTSGFYHWRSRPQSATSKRRDVLAQRIRLFFDAAHGTYGYRRIHADLRAGGIECSPELVRSIMREHEMVPCQPRRFRTTTESGDDGKVPDLVKRDFTADRPGMKFVGDITYIHTWQGFVYLATVIDCFSRKVVGWSIADHMRTELVAAALTNAAATSLIEPEAVFHSDRGSVYTSRIYRRLVAGMGMRSSMGRTGQCWDNSMAESFFAALKNECVYRTVYATKSKARQDIIRYIEGFYNPRRRHSALNYQAPNDVHYSYRQHANAA
ncbi:IS3 family transposase [Rhodococcus qingshengii]|uniref:IS3 family transposase n=1 Tax=Rhodococcus qingshengii TaxID=334542 RepID=UPI001BE59CA1|nr:IS3 family transposase [Rhodococcus qingshengii]MBT2273598.1 IS3 family transposase [Rhodococcus qingshengii]